MWRQGWVTREAGRDRESGKADQDEARTIE
jgi:hypothetical protein